MIPRLGFAALLAVIVLVAVPFGANRMWAWGLLALIVGGMMIVMAVNICPVDMGSKRLLAKCSQPQTSE